MTKRILFFCFLAGIVSSCGRRQYTCTCTVAAAHVIDLGEKQVIQMNNSTKSEAELACTNAAQSGRYTGCKLDK